MDTNTNTHNNNFCLLDVNKLSQASIRKYATYFRIQEEDLNLLKILIVQHFKNQLKVDTQNTISEMLNLKRMQTERQLKRLRNGRNHNSNIRAPQSQKNH